MKKSTNSELSDEDLVVKITDQNKELYVHIVERYQAPLIRYARTIVYDQESAEDVVQNSFIKAYQNLRSFKVDKKFSSWIYRIVHNEAINYIKKRKRELRPEDESWFDTIADDRISAADQVDKDLVEGIAAKTLLTIDIKYREPLSLHFFEAKSYQEISEILRVPVATVGTRISRGKQKLKSALRAEGVKDV